MFSLHDPRAHSISLSEILFCLLIAFISVFQIVSELLKYITIRVISESSECRTCARSESRDGSVQHQRPRLHRGQTSEHVREIVLEATLSISKHCREGNGDLISDNNELIVKNNHRLRELNMSPLGAFRLLALADALPLEWREGLKTISYIEDEPF